MSEQPEIRDVRFSSADQDQAKTGLLGWLSFTFSDTLRLDGVMLRRTADGRLTLSYPSRRDRAGETHYVVRPVSDAARTAIEQHVFWALGFNGHSEC